MVTINGFFRKFINKYNRLRLSNNTFTLLSNNCNGCLICKDMNIRYNSPFVNLYLTPTDFIKYIKNIDHYNNLKLTFINVETKDYPVGVLGDIELNFVHYQNEQEAKEKWNERKTRINLDNLFILMTERDGCTMDDLIEFDNLSYKNKVVFTKLPYKNIKSSYYIKGFEKDKEVGLLFKFKNRYTGKKYYDDFDYVSWFNGKLKKYNKL